MFCKEVQSVPKTVFFVVDCSQNTRNGPKTGEFETKIGPVCANFVLLDEINRSSSKTQSAMLEAMQEKQWLSAMKEELGIIEKNNTWQLVQRPTDRKVIGVKWVFRTKLNVDGSVNKYKARLVVKGYAQIFGVNFSETFAPVARFDTIQLLLAVAAQKGWKVF